MAQGLIPRDEYLDILPKRTDYERFIKIYCEKGGIDCHKLYATDDPVIWLTHTKQYKINMYFHVFHYVNCFAVNKRIVPNKVKLISTELFRKESILCFSHYIQAKVLEQIVLNDIQEKARYIILDEQAVREEFIRHNAELTDSSVKTAQKELTTKQRGWKNCLG